MSSGRSILSGMKMLIGQKWVGNQALIVEGTRIKGIIGTEMVKHHLPARHYEFPDNYSLVPGFIDLHIHGASGYDVMDNSQEALDKISMTLAKEGVTNFLATTITAEKAQIEAVLKTIAEFKQQPEGNVILGVHLEGPFISLEKANAQRKDLVLEPDIKLIKKFQRRSNNNIKIVTLAPEINNAIDFIKALRDMDIIVGIGHSNATYEDAIVAINAGCTYATHLFNAMRIIHQREPGGSIALLLSDKINAELILDNMHLHPAMAQLAFAIKGPTRLFLVTDAMRAKCMGDGQYDLGGQLVSVKDGRATLADGTLAGSTLTLPKAIKNMTQASRCSLAESIAMATYNPAHVLGISTRKGSIEVNKDADLVVLNADFDVQLTMREGKCVFEKR